jgi:hypothetical protein
MNDLQKLYDVLVRDGYYTKSFDEFKVKWQDQTYQDKVYGVVSRDGLFTKSKNEFLSKYSGQQEPLKKKEPTVSASKSGKPSSVSSSRRFEGATVEPISQKKYRTDDYIDQVQNAKTQPKQTKTVVANTFVPNAKEQKVDVITTDEANQMMAEDFGKKEFELYSQISEIDPNVFKEGEESAVKYLNDKFKGSGFVFEETGLGTNEITVKSTLNDGFGTVINEKTIKLPTSLFPGMESAKSAATENAQKEITDFMQQAFLKKSEKEFLSEDVKDYGQLVKLAANNPYKYGEEFLNQYDTERWMDNQYRDLVIAGKNIKREQETLQREIDAYKESGVYNEETERLIRTRAANLQNQVQANTSKYEELQDISAKLPKAAAVYFQKKEKEGNIPGLILGGVVKGMMAPTTALSTTGVDIAPLLIPSKYLIPEVQQVRLKASGMSDAEIKDYAAKQMRKYLDDGIDRANYIASLGTTEEYKQSEDRNDLEKVATFLSESIGTAIAGGGNPLLTKIAFFSQSYNAIEDEMNSPQFDGMSQMEKKIMSVPYGLVIGQLDRLGFNVATKIGNNPVLNKLITNTIANAFTSLPKNASVEVIDKAIGESLKATMAKTGLEIVGGSLVEGLTEGTQSLAEYGMKNLYNNFVADKDVFQDVPDITTKEGLDKALSAAKEEFYYGALGGAIMSSGSTALKSLSKGFDKGAEEFDFFSKVINDPKLRALIETDIKTKITSGEITKAEAQEQLDAINKSVSILNKMPENLPNESKMEAYNLILEKNKIEKEIAGKDSALVAAQTERVAEINEQLKQLSKDAVQKQTAGEVPVQPGAAVSGEMAQGESEAGPQEVTQESQQEEELKTISDRILKIEEASSRGELLEDLEPGELKKLKERKKELENNLSKKAETTLTEGELVLNSINPTGSIFAEYTPEQRDALPLGKDITTYDETAGISPTEKVTVYRGVPNGVNEIKSGDFVTTNEQLAKDYAGEGKVISMEVNANEILDDKTEPLGEEYILRIKKPITQIEETVVEEETPTETKIEDIEVDETPMADDLMDEVTKLKNLTTKQDFTNVDIKNPGRRKVVAQAAKAAKAISKVLPKVKIVLHSKSEDYVNATKEMGGRLSEGGLYNNKRKEIHINLEKANNRTVAHEVFHALLISRVKSDADAQKLTKSMIDSVIKSLLVTEKGGAKVLSYLQDFSNRYEDNVKNEEKLAELFSILADNYKTLPEPSRNIIRRFLDRLASLFGIKKMTDSDVIQFMNTLSRKVEEGVEIEQYEVGKIQNAKDINTRFQANFSDAVSKLTFEYDKNNERFEKLEKEGYITRDKSIDDFAGKFMLLHQPDAAFSGSIYKDGELLVEGKGGVFYPIKFHEDGYFWASTSKTAKKMADDLNKVMDQNGGTIYMALTSAPYDKLMSSTTMSNAILDFFSSKAFDSNFKITPAQLNIALRKAANDVKVVNNKKIGLGLGLASDASLSDVKSKIKEALNADNSSFADRKNFAEELIKIMADKIKNDPKATQQFGELFSEGIQNKYFKGKTKTGKLKISPANMVQAISEMFTEPILKEGVDREKGGQVYAVVELSGKVKPTESTKHESYPMAIQADSDSKVKIHLLKDRKKWNEVFLDPDTNEAVDKAREKKIFPTTGVSTKGLQVGGFATRKQKLEQDVNKSQIKIYGEDFTDVFNKLGIPFEYLKDIKEKNIPDWLGGKNKKITELRNSLLKSIDYRINLLENDLAKQSRKLINSESDFEFRRSLMNKKTDKISSLEKLRDSIKENLLSEKDIEILTNQEEFATRKQKLAPNGKPSNLDDRQWDQVRTPAFKKWFGDWENDPKNASKVVDENGEPLVVYHGSQENFDEFAKKYPKHPRNGYEVEGYWFTSSDENAKNYTRENPNFIKESDKPGVIYKVFLNIKNPIVFDMGNSKSPNSKIFDEMGWPANLQSRVSWKDLQQAVYRNKSIHDGVVFDNIKDTLLATNFQVFKPNQIKSATENEGTFDEGDFSIRKQKLSDVDQIVDTAKKNNISDDAIRQLAKDQGFTDREVSDAIQNYNNKAEGIFIKSKDGGVKTVITDAARKYRQKYFSSKGFLPKIGFTYKERMEQQIAKEANQADKVARKFSRMFHSYKGDKDALISDFDKYLRGDTSVKLPEGFGRIADQMRAHIDKLSQDLIASGMVDDPAIEVIVNNMGSYLTRSYEIYDNKNWKQKVTQETIDKAKNFLKNQPGFMDMAVEQSAKEGIPLDEVLQTMVDNKIEEWLSKDNAKALISGSKLGSKDLSILKQKQDIPEELRMLMGEYTDPAMNYARTILKISNLTAKHKFLVDMKKAGLNKFFFEENNPRKPLAFNTKLAAEGSETMNPLNGLYTTPEIAEAFGGFMSPNSEISKLLEYYYKAMVGVKWAKTIGSVSTHMKNVIGNLGFVALNGHNLRELGNSLKVLRADFTGLDDADLQKKINEYIELGVIKQGAGINEIKDMFKDARIDTFLEQRISSKTPKTKRERLSNLTKKKAVQLKVFLEELYQAEDDMYKIVAFETEMSRYSKALYGKSKSQLTEDQRKRVTEKASEVIKNLYPSYNRIPEAIKKMRRVPLFFGSFISFQAESLRTSYKTFELIKEEINSENPEIRKIGAKRLAYATAYLSMKTAALSFASMAAGTGMSGVLGAIFDDDDEKEKEKDVREFVAPWSKDSDLIILKAGDGTVDYIDFSASDPHGGLNRAMNAFLKGDNPIDAFSDGVVALAAPFLGGDITTTALLNLKNNTNQYGGQIYNPEDDFEDQSIDVLEHIYKLVEPGTVTTVRRIVESDNKPNEILGMTGFKVQSVDLAKQFGFKTKEFSERLNDTKRPYNTEYYKTVEIIADPRSSKEGRQEQIDKTEVEYEKSTKKYNQVAEEFKEVFNSALRLGTDYDLLETIIMDGRTFSKKNLYDWEDGFKLEIPYKEY